MAMIPRYGRQFGPYRAREGRPQQPPRASLILYAFVVLLIDPTAQPTQCACIAQEQGRYRPSSARQVGGSLVVVISRCRLAAAGSYPLRLQPPPQTRSPFLTCGISRTSSHRQIIPFTEYQIRDADNPHLSSVRPGQKMTTMTTATAQSVSRRMCVDDGWIGMAGDVAGRSPQHQHTRTGLHAGWPVKPRDTAGF